MRDPREPVASSPLSYIIDYNVETVRQTLIDHLAQGRWTVSGIVEHSGLDEDTVRRFVNRRTRNPSLKTAVAIATAMQLHLRVIGCPIAVPTNVKKPQDG